MGQHSGRVVSQCSILSLCGTLSSIPFHIGSASSLLIASVGPAHVALGIAGVSGGASEAETSSTAKLQKKDRAPN